MQNIYLFLRLSILTIYSSINSAITCIYNYISKLSLSIFKTNIFIKNYVLNFIYSYIAYLIFLSFFLITWDSINFKFIYSLVYFQYVLSTILYFVFTLFYNLIISGISFKLNFESIYFLYEYNTSIFLDNFLNVLNFKIIDFYQFIVLDYLINTKIFFTEMYYNILTYPLFILFAVLFLFTSFFSLLALSYLGFYGVFILNFISLALLWLSVLPYFLSIFSKNVFYYISLGK